MTKWSPLVCGTTEKMVFTELGNNNALPHVLGTKACYPLTTNWNFSNIYNK